MRVSADAKIAHQGQKLSEKLLKQIEAEEPMVSLIGLGVAFAWVAFSRAKIHRTHAMSLMETLYNAMMNPETEEPQQAASRLILPSR